VRLNDGIWITCRRSNTIKELKKCKNATKIKNMPRKMKIMIIPCKICNENIFEFLCKS
jgi:hypothetical protein